MPIIEAEAVSKVYPARRGTRDLRGRGGIGDWLRGRKTGGFHALRDITLAIEPGESLGIIGRNGSGKSTLLKILAGVTLPTSGRVRAHGRVASLLELGAGFHPVLTGRENIYLNAGMLGMRHAQTDEVLEDIIEFSGIREFIDQPVDTYSSGMYVRIGFAVAVHTNPDIFLVDEVLAVGDEEFQRKCRVRIGELKEQGKTIVFVSHDLGAVHALCDRVALLSEGRMMNRGSPQKTIDYYLRQIGRQSGIHRMEAGALEAIFSHGRISLFQERREVSAPRGFEMRLVSLGRDHLSSQADWEVVERGPASCVARAEMTRLPVRMHWEIELAEGRLHWRAAIECLHDVALDSIDLFAFLPAFFSRWHYGDAAGRFPEIHPGHLEWATIAPSQMDVREAALLDERHDGLPPVVARLRPVSPFFLMALENSDYMTGARVVGVHGWLPQSEQPLRAGRHELAEVVLDLSMGAADFDAWRAAQERQRSAVSGPWHAHFARGAVELLRGEQRLTTMMHLHTQMRIQNLWTLSDALQWEAVERDGGTLRMTGGSPRFPLRQVWELAPDARGFRFRVVLEAEEAVTLQEYNVSAALPAAYTHWRTATEEGAFPDFTPGQEEWRHVNKDYAPGGFVEARGGGLPAIRLEPGPEDRLHMTAINTGYNMRARVLQGIGAASQAGLLRFEPGHHTLFDGFVVLAEEPADA